MYQIEMTVHHGSVETAGGYGANLQQALEDTLDTRVGRAYGPSTDLAWDALYDTLEMHGRAQHGWADFVLYYED